MFARERKNSGQK
uniref:Uncharacterized protein n=1 Tax=Arundo donax TaxID=35708 RepID=A0A0A8Y4E1_ARUDO